MTFLQIGGAAAAVVVAWLVQAFVLRRACALYNRLQGRSADGRDAVRGYAIYVAPDQKTYRPPKAFERYRRADHARGGVPAPSFRKALLIGLGHLGVGALVGALVGLVIAVLGRLGGAGPELQGLAAAFVLLPTLVLLLAAVLRGALPTTWGRAISVALLNLLVYAVVGVAATTAWLAVVGAAPSLVAAGG